MEEKWTKASDFPMYEVSDKGRIRNAKTGRIMKTQINDKGYETLSLVKNNSKHTVALHRIIAKSFYDSCYEGLDVNHVDGNNLNNRMENLEFCTRKENVQHALRIGLRSNNDYGRHGVKIRCLETGETFNSLNECERRIGVDHSELSKYLSGKINRLPKGYHFERID